MYLSNKIIIQKICISSPLKRKNAKTKICVLSINLSSMHFFTAKIASNKVTISNFDPSPCTCDDQTLSNKMS